MLKLSRLDRYLAAELPADANGIVWKTLGGGVGKCGRFGATAADCGVECLRTRGTGRGETTGTSPLSTSFSIGVFSRSLSSSLALTAVTMAGATFLLSAVVRLTDGADPVTGVHLSELGALNVLCCDVTALEAPPADPAGKSGVVILEGVPIGVGSGLVDARLNPTR